MSDVFKTNPEDALVHESGWARLPSGIEVMCLPLVDGPTGLFARLSYADAKKLASAGRRLGPSPSVIEELAQQHALSRREVELHVVSGGTRAEALSAMNISENTLKSHTRSLLRKVDACDLHDLTVHVLRRALNA